MAFRGGGKNDARHPNRQVGSHRWKHRFPDDDLANHTMFTTMDDDYGGEGYGEVYSNARIGGNPDWKPGRTHSGFMASYEASNYARNSHPGEHGLVVAGPFRTQARAQIAVGGLHERYMRGEDLSMYER